MILDKRISSIFWGWICENLSIFKPQIEKNFAYIKKHVIKNTSFIRVDTKNFVLVRVVALSNFLTVYNSALNPAHVLEWIF